MNNVKTQIIDENGEKFLVVDGLGKQLKVKLPKNVNVTNIDVSQKTAPIADTLVEPNDENDEISEEYDTDLNLEDKELI